MGDDIWAARGKIGTKLALQRDSQGGYIKFDIRENEEQAEKLHQSVELLVAAGYFRARIKGLAAFDKIVGGMTWCISVCNIPIDIDLLYQENSTIGQKIALTEKIVRVLGQLKCPYRIEPHQIQGLDMISIFPLIQWLVKLALETREERSDAIRRFFVWKFDREHTDYTRDQGVLQKKNAEALLNELNSKNTPVRLFKRRSDNSSSPLEARVLTTLREYDTKAKAAQGSQPQSGPSSAFGSTEDLEQVAHDEPQLSLDVIESVIDRQETTTQQKAGTEIASDQVQRLRAEQKALEGESEQARNKYNEGRGQLTAQDRSLAINQRLAQLQTEQDIEDAAALEELTSKFEEVKEAERKYKQWCKAEYSRLSEELSSLKAAEFSSNQALTPEMVQNHAEMKARLEQARLLLAEKNQEIAVLQRKVDDVPSRAELNQYQRRFLELYNQMAAKHRETKQFYTLYNTLQDVKEYMEKEINLLNSMFDNYETAMGSLNAKSQFLNQVENIVEGIKDARVKLDRGDAQEKSKRFALKEERSELAERERKYHQTVRDFQEACRRNEELRSQSSDS